MGTHGQAEGPPRGPAVKEAGFSLQPLSVPQTPGAGERPPLAETGRIRTRPQQASVMPRDSIYAREGHTGFQTGSSASEAGTDPCWLIPKRCRVVALRKYLFLASQKLPSGGDGARPPPVTPGRAQTVRAWFLTGRSESQRCPPQPHATGQKVLTWVQGHASGHPKSLETTCRSVCTQLCASFWGERAPLLRFAKGPGTQRRLCVVALKVSRVTSHLAQV